MNELIKEKVNKIAGKHAQIIEKECKIACEKFNVTGDKLIIEFHANAEIKIKINASHFKIENNFILEPGVIK